METTEKSFTLLSNEELATIIGGKLIPISVYKDGEVVIIWREVED